MADPGGQIRSWPPIEVGNGVWPPLEGRLGGRKCNDSIVNLSKWDVMAHWLRRLLSTGGSWVRLPLWPSRMDLGQVLYLQLPVRFGVKLRYSIRAVVGSASEW